MLYMVIVMCYLNDLKVVCWVVWVNVKKKGCNFGIYKENLGQLYIL